MDDKYSSISEFKQHLKETGLVEEKHEYGWVLWQHSKIREELQCTIITLLKLATCSLLESSHDYLIQFWAVAKVEGEHHHYMSASEQPFCVGNGGLRKGVCRYRKQCMDHMYFVNLEAGEANSVGSVARTYQNKYPESTPDVKTYCSNGFQLHHNAVRSGFKCYSATLLCDGFPSHQCYGVLEILCNPYTTLQELRISMNDELKLLTTPKDVMGGRFSLIADGLFNRDHEYQEKLDKSLSKERNATYYASLPGPLKLLCSYVMDDLYDGSSIPIALDDGVFGEKCVVYVRPEDIIPFCNLKPYCDMKLTSGNCMVVYIWHLYNKIKKENTLKRFMFVNPRTIYVVHGKTKERDELAMRLIDAYPDQLVLVPCNLGLGNYWCLTVIEPYKNVVSFLGPVSNITRLQPWKFIVNSAIGRFRNVKNYPKEKPTWNFIKVRCRPRGEHAVTRQCGYHVMRYMKKIVQGLNTIDSTSLSSLFINGDCSQTDIDEVRSEWAHCVINNI